MKRFFLFAAMLASAASSFSQVYITEFMWRGNTRLGDQFVELTNFGPAAVDVSGWRLWNKGNVTNGWSLDNLDSIAPGESVVILSQYVGDEEFRDVWPDLTSGVQFEPGGTDMAREDFILIRDENGDPVDRIDFYDINNPDLINARGVSAVTTFGNLGKNIFADWFLSNDAPDGSDDFTNLTSIYNDIGTPGYLNFAYTPVPEPASAAALLGLLALGAASLRRRR
ncbi:lamin tail domain-containing protein [Rariglobus hedericola]|uniref:Lamin tail domain-containing protein n=1 Tax=Rariglobus hedericola TaxID=2597822 RepID=A0A556QRD7_9BACT|nr:lamin tail domain-containing protein [Rariglobus hedericola]TSJ79192.1 lamin tail domain-containing protein [Rariglobus hedericola]